MRNLIKYISVCFYFCLVSCTSNPRNVTDNNEYPPVYPDYTDIVIPYNIAPLNFLLRNDADAVQVVVHGKKEKLVVNDGNSVHFPLKKWRALLEKEKDNELTIQVTARVNRKWVRYKSFYWKVVPDRLDSYLSYRLIEPGYEVWNKLQLRERNLENFDERTIADNNLTDKACMNCHIHGNQDGRLSMFHIRGKNGGTVLNRNGALRKLNLKKEGLISGAVYGAFHPSGKYGIFSVNTIIPEFHALASRRLEVYDTNSDLILVDFDKNQIISCPLLADSTQLETFPVFSSDGKSIYYCSAKKLLLPDDIKSLKYSLCRVDFDNKTREIGAKADTIYNARITGKSVCHPKISPDGKYILFTIADYGTFPIWHREADLVMMELESGKILDLSQVNSNCSDTYHSWSSNSRWFVFASKRDDGQYGKPYFSYVDNQGRAYKAFVLPQREPGMYDTNLKSYNLPDLSKDRVTFDASDIETVYEKYSAESFN